MTDLVAQLQQAAVSLRPHNWDGAETDDDYVYLWKCVACGEWIDDANANDMPYYDRGCVVEWTPPSLYQLAAVEIDHLRALITDWCDVSDDMNAHPSDYHPNVAAAEDALRKAVGR